MKPDPKKFAAAKKKLLRGLRRQIKEAEQMIRDLQWWNEHRTDCEPFDIGGTIVYANIARQLLALVETDQMIPRELWNRLQTQAELNASN